MNQKGIAHLLAILIIGALITAGAGYILYNNSNDSDLGSTGQGLEIGGGDDIDGVTTDWDAYNNAQAALDELEWIEDYVENNDVIYDEDEQAADFEEIQRKVQEDAREIIDNSFCGATIEDVRSALQMTARAQSAGLLELGDQLFEWAKNAYISSLSQEAPQWADDPSEEAVEQWLYYWNLSGMLGMADIMDTILHGRINLSSWYSEYNCTQGQSRVEGTPLDKQIDLLLAKDFCKADIDEVKEGIIIAERVQLLGKERDDDVMDWSKNGFTAFVGKNHEDFDAGERAEYAGIAQMLGLQSLGDDIQANRVDLEDWLEQNCEKKGGYRVNFGDQTYIRRSGESTWTYKITNAYAYTCDGLFSRWQGYATMTSELAIPGYPTQSFGGGESDFGFLLVDEESASRGATLVHLEGKQITVWIPMANFTEGGSNLTGTYFEDSSACN